MPQSLLQHGAVAEIESLVDSAERYLRANYPGDRPDPQPVHTVYTSAACASPEVVNDWSATAVRILDTNRHVLSELTDGCVVDRARSRLMDAPIMDLRFDFEDGYRGDDEDGDIRRTGAALAVLGVKGGIRIPGLTSTDWRRSVHILETLFDQWGSVPAQFVFTVPKFRALQQVTAAVKLCGALEQAHGLQANTVRFELQIESPQAVIAADGSATVARAVHESEGRCESLHYGTYDYSAACGISAPDQSLDHPVADHAKAVMLAAAAQTGTWVADGSTQIVPRGDADQVADALRLHFALVTRSLRRGYYQGWDMHPGHLVTRWLADFTFYRSALEVAVPRLSAYLGHSDDFDEPASAEALARVVLRGLDCGAYTEESVGLGPRSVLTDLVERKRTGAD
jgi:citrate lyase beta subunit